MGQSKPQASLEALKNHTDVCLGLWFSDGLDDLGGSFPILTFPILITHVRRETLCRWKAVLVFGMDPGHWGWKRAELALVSPWCFWLWRMLVQGLLPSAGAGLCPSLPISSLGVCPRWVFLGLVQLSCEYPALPARENGLLQQNFKLLLTFGYQ